MTEREDEKLTKRIQSYFRRADEGTVGDDTSGDTLESYPFNAPKSPSRSPDSPVNQIEFDDIFSNKRVKELKDKSESCCSLRFSSKLNDGTILRDSTKRGSLGYSGSSSSYDLSYWNDLRPRKQKNVSTGSNSEDDRQFQLMFYGEEDPRLVDLDGKVQINFFSTRGCFPCAAGSDSEDGRGALRDRKGRRKEKSIKMADIKPRRAKDLEEITRWYRGYDDDTCGYPANYNEMGGYIDDLAAYMHNDRMRYEPGAYNNNSCGPKRLVRNEERYQDGSPSVWQSYEEDPSGGYHDHGRMRNYHHEHDEGRRARTDYYDQDCARRYETTVRERDQSKPPSRGERGSKFVGYSPDFDDNDYPSHRNCMTDRIQGYRPANGLQRSPGNPNLFVPHPPLIHCQEEFSRDPYECCAQRKPTPSKLCNSCKENFNKHRSCSYDTVCEGNCGRKMKAKPKCNERVGSRCPSGCLEKIADMFSKPAQGKKHDASLCIFCKKRMFCGVRGGVRNMKPCSQPCDDLCFLRRPPVTPPPPPRRSHSPPPRSPSRNEDPEYGYNRRATYDPIERREMCSREAYDRRGLNDRREMYDKYDRREDCDTSERACERTRNRKCEFGRCRDELSEACDGPVLKSKCVHAKKKKDPPQPPPPTPAHKPCTCKESMAKECEDGSCSVQKKQSFFSRLYDALADDVQPRETKCCTSKKKTCCDTVKIEKGS